MQAATLAAHRFGFAETSLAALRGDPRGWVLAQLREPAPLDGAGLAGSAEAGEMTRAVLRRALAAPAPSMAASAPADDATPRDPDRLRLRRANLAALQRRWQHVIATPTPVAERWTLFWSNHFCVAATKGATLALVAPHEREAIRPHAFGRFRDLLRAATLHPAMLLYLDNAQSVGPGSRAGRRRERGLNENLARELLELHTLGVDGGYTQADVTELAKLLTGRTVDREGPMTAEFRRAIHEPADKRVLGRRYREGPEAVEALFDDLSRHPSTARHLATKLARHFVADDPPAALVDALAARFRDSDGDLRALAETLFTHELAWRAEGPPKFKRPEELLLSAHRLMKLPILRPERAQTALVQMGQPPGRAPSPQGWPDRSEDWLAPDALWKRVQWASAFADEHAAFADARQLASLSFGADLGAGTATQIERAESGRQALALLLASPEFQRR
ncbi:DUF1800 domain-containing protein [Caldimonas sp. KR1-144]|uniref:DUF1800 domain-containing protein n=1 Tax=Caldimonas sp. KR1-144 TaxID=3400911 RepID=UPI003BFB9265